MGNKAAGRPPGGQGRRDDPAPPARPDTGDKILDQVLRDLVVAREDASKARSAADIAVSRVVTVSEAVTKLGDALAAHAEGHAAQAQRSAESTDVEEAAEPWPADWYSVTTERQAQAVLTELVEWVARVYLRGPADARLTYCWMWHPTVVDELLALRWSYNEAHHGERADAYKAGDWRDRYRKGAIERINADLKQCSLARHKPGAEKEWLPARVPGLDDVDPAKQLVELAAWWATSRESAPPPPSKNLLALEQASLYRDDD